MRLRVWLRKNLGLRLKHQVLEQHPVSLQESLATMVRCLDQKDVRYALIGGIALSVRGYVRATEDIDFLIDADHETRLHQLMTNLKFETLQRTENVSNYLLGHTRVDFLHARRKYSRAMLDRATTFSSNSLQTRVVTTEDLIGLKVQSITNNPKRTQDRVDIQQLLTLSSNVDMSLVREYFRVFDRESELDEILQAIKRDG